MGEDWGKQKTLVTNMEINRRENSRLSFPVKALLLPVGGLVAPGVTCERRTSILRNSCVEVNMVV